MPRALVILAFVTSAAAQTFPPLSALNGKVSSTLAVADSSGNIYIAGTTTTPGLPVSSDAVQPAYAGGTCIGLPFPGPISAPCSNLFLAKLDPTGTQLVAATYLGGHGNDSPAAIAVDAQGTLYVAGVSDSLTFLPLTGALVTGRANFVARLSTNFDKVIYGAARPDLPVAGLAVDASGNAWTIGTTDSMPAVPMLAKISPSGTITLQQPISDLDAVSAVAVDTAGNPVAVGYKVGPQNGHVGVVRFDTSGVPLSTALFGTDQSSLRGLAVAPAGSVYVVGATTGSANPAADHIGGFFVRIALDGTSQILTIGRSLDAVAIAADGSAFAAGTASAGVPTTADALLRCRSGPSSNVSGFVAGWDGAAAAPFYATYLGYSAPGNSALPGLISLDASGAGTVLTPALLFAGNFVTRFRRGVDAGQPACVDPLPANLANSLYFAASDPGQLLPWIAAGEYVIFYGSGVGPDNAVQWDPAGAVPTELGGVRLLVGGHPAPLLSVSANQIIAIMPLELEVAGTTAVAIERDGASVASTQVPLGTAAPVIFGASATNFVQRAVFNEDFSLNSAANPAMPGDVIAVFVSGGGALTPAPADGTLVPPGSLPLAAAPVTALIMGDGAQTVTFAGQAANAAAGLLQVNVRIAPDFPLHGRMTLQLSVGGQPATAVFWIP